MNAIVLLSGYSGFCVLLLLIVQRLRRYGGDAIVVALIGSSFFTWLGAVKYSLIEESIRGHFDEETIFLTLVLTAVSQLIIFYGAPAPNLRSLGFTVPAAPPVPLTLKWLLIVLAFAAIAGAVPTEGGYPVLVRGIAQGVCIAAIAITISRRQHALTVVLLIVMLLSLATGGYTSRRLYIAVFLPIIIIWSGGRPIRIFSPRGIIISLSAVALLLFLAFMRADHLVPEEMLNSSLGEKLYYTLVNLRNIDTFWNTAFVVSEFGSNYDYYFGTTYLSVPVGLIPRDYWPDKPVGFGAPLGLLVMFGVRDFSNELWMKANQFSLSPGFVGEAFANFGIAGVILVSMLFRFFMLRVWRNSHGLPGPSTSHWVILIPTLLTSFRGDFYSAVNFSLFMFIGAFAYNKSYNFFTRQRSTLPKRRHI